MLVHKDETYTGRKYKQFSIIWRKTFLAHWSTKINFWRPKKFGVRERSPHSARGPHTGRGVDLVKDKLVKDKLVLLHQYNNKLLIVYIFYSSHRSYSIFDTHILQFYFADESTTRAPRARPAIATPTQSVSAATTERARPTRQQISCSVTATRTLPAHIAWHRRRARGCTDYKSSKQFFFEVNNWKIH